MTTFSGKNVTKQQNACLVSGDTVPIISDPIIIRRVEIMCELFEMAYEIKSLELKRRNPDASDAWVRSETLRLIEAGTK